MSKFHDFLVEHAKFPFPPLNEDLSSSTSDISILDVDLIKTEWKAKFAVRDDTLVQKLCDALQDNLGDAPLADGDENYLLANFSPRTQFDERGREEMDWSTNSSEIHTQRLLNMGFFTAAGKCLWVYDQSTFETTLEHLAERGGSKVDYLALVHNKPTALCEAESPSVMKNLCDSLPSHGIQFKWVHAQPLVPKILSKAALYLGLRKTEWLFLTCHNYWIVCRLVRDDDTPYLAYSPGISIQDSSQPFRAFLGAILSVVKDVPVESSAYNPNIKLDTRADIGPPMARSRDRNSCENTESELLVTSSSPKLPENLQVWTRLYSMSNNSLAFPPCAGSDKLRLWFTRFIASGSTGSVWECRFDASYDSFAAKIVEVLRPSDTENRQRLRNEFKIYLILDEAYQFGRLHDRIAPRCYGAFEGSKMDVLILDLCDSILNSWDDLSASERSDVYKLVQDLHSIGIAHEDLAPRNIGRTHGGGFLLIDFSESRKHVCKESKVGVPHTHLAPDQEQKCYELQSLQKLLWKRQPLQAGSMAFVIGL